MMRTTARTARMALLLPLGCSACGLILGDDFELSSSAKLCAPLPLGSCGQGKKCSVVDLETGATACIGAGPRPAWASCVDDLNCVEGTYCSGDGVCNPICAAPEDCTNGGWCVDAYGPNWVPAPGLSICLSDCQPLTAAPCEAAFGPIACVTWGIENEFSCYSSAGYSEGATCSLDVVQCGPGLVCITESPPHCRRWCTPVNQQGNCANGQICTPFAPPPVLHDGTEFGYCH
jgi:hypothetical protein